MIDEKINDELPIVYSCSGCSNIAQLTNKIAVKLDRNGLAEMSCIAGVGGNVKPLVKKALSGKPIIAIDGCKLHCAKACLNQINIKPDIHITLTDFDLKKRFHEDCDEIEFKIMYEFVRKKVTQINEYVEEN